MNDIHSKIDTDRFGFKIGKTDGSTFENNISETMSLLAKKDYRLIIARVDMYNIKLINKMEKSGFMIKDSQITYKFNLERYNFDSQHYDSSVDIRDFEKSDINHLVNMAKESFNGYGHYFANEDLDRKKCLEVYEDWAYKSCVDPNVADKIIVACDSNSKPIGYLSFKIKKDQSGKKYAAGGMGAVSPESRGLGVFPRILLAGLGWGKNIGLDWEEHNVIVNNFPVNRSMNKLGFLPGNPVFTMHCWIK